MRLGRVENIELRARHYCLAKEDLPVLSLQLTDLTYDLLTF